MSRVQHTSRDAWKRKRDENEKPTIEMTTTTTTKKKKKKTAPYPTLPKIAGKQADATGYVASNASQSTEVGEVNEAIGQMDDSLLADYFAKQIKRHLGNLSTLELDEKYLPSKAFLNTSDFQPSRNLSTLPKYIEQFTPGGKEELSSAAEATSSPHTLFVAPSGIRAADVTRALRVFQSDGAAIAKLFAKHIKLADSIVYVKKTRIGIGVGTPARVQDLLKAEALKISNLKRIVIDGSYVDQKKRSLFDMREMFVPLLDFLSHQTLVQRYGDGTLQVLVF